MIAILRSLLPLCAACLAGLLALVSFVIPTDAQAQNSGADVTPVHSTVAQVLENPEDDQDVTLRGFLLEKLSTEKYTFSDDTGQIRVEIDNDEFPNFEIDPDTRIEIAGEVETAFMRQPEIDVERLKILDTSSDPSSPNTISNDV